MNHYRCFFSRSADGVSEFLVIDAEDDDAARAKASKVLNASTTYVSVEMFEGGRCLGVIERTPRTASQPN